MIALTAATPWEFDPFARGLGLEPWNGREDYAWGQLGSQKIFLIRTGVGPSKTAETMRRLRDEIGVPDIVVSSGFAGAALPGIRSGDLVADLRESPIDVAASARETARRMGTELHLGKILSVDRVLTAPGAKRSIGEEHRAIAVDMESSAVRDWCRGHGAAFLAIRTVLDALEDRLPTPPPGEADLSAGEWTGYALRNWREIPLMMSLFGRQRRAISGLGRFLRSFLAEMDANVPNIGNSFVRDVSNEHTVDV